MKMNIYNLSDFPEVQFWSFFDPMYPFVKTDSGLSGCCHGNVDFPSGQRARSLYTKGLYLCDKVIHKVELVACNGRHLVTEQEWTKVRPGLVCNGLHLWKRN